VRCTFIKQKRVKDPFYTRWLNSRLVKVHFQENMAVSFSHETDLLIIDKFVKDPVLPVGGKLRVLKKIFLREFV